MQLIELFSCFHRNSAIWLFSVLIVFTSACIDEIDLNTRVSGDNQLVIQGQLIKGDPSTARVRVSRAAVFTRQSLPTPISEAEVFLQDQSTSVQLSEIESGLYEVNIDQSSGAFQVNTGDQYKISVRLPDGGVYESSFETLVKVPSPDSVSVKITQREELNNSGNSIIKNFLEVFIHTALSTDEGKLVSLLWFFDGVYRVDENPPPPGSAKTPKICYVPQRLNLAKVVVFSGNKSNASQLSAFKLMEEEIDHRFSQGYLLKIRQQSLSESAFEYWEKVSQIVGLSGGLFEPPPGKIQGNISNIEDPSQEVQGYFYASDEIVIHRFVTRDEAGIPKGYCGSLGINPALELCDDCLLIPSSTVTISQFWEL